MFGFTKMINLGNENLDALSLHPGFGIYKLSCFANSLSF